MAIAPRSVPSLLCATTSRAAIHFAAPHTAVGSTAAAIAREVLQTMMIQTLRSYATGTMAMAVLAAVAGSMVAAGGQPVRPASRPASPTTTQKAAPAEEGRMTVTGRVIGLDGRPAPGVPIDIVAATRTPPSATDAEREPFVVLGQGSADAEGHFQIESTRASSSRYRDVYVLAGATGPGSAFGCVSLPTDSDRPEAEVYLQPERPIRGRLVDIQGQPAAGVEVQLRTVYSDRDRLDGGRFDSPVPTRGYLWSGAPPGLRAWPRAVTDAQGRFTLAGVGRGLELWLSVRDPRYAQQQFRFPADDMYASGGELSPSRLSACDDHRGPPSLAGDTGRPIPGAVIAVRSSTSQFGPMMTTKFRADDRGYLPDQPARRRLLPPAGLRPRGAAVSRRRGGVRLDQGGREEGEGPYPRLRRATGRHTD